VSEELIVITYAGRPLRFAPCGGTVERKLRANQWYEAELLQYIETLALPGVYIDVGGYVGTHALFFAAHCPSTRVHTFEPRPHCHRLLRTNIDANELGEKVDLSDLGLSDRAETVTVRLDNKDVEFDCRKLDDVVSGPVSVMKLDVEGMEAKVLAGAERILREHRPLLFAEANTDDDLKALTSVLEPFGYRLTGRVFNGSPTYELAATDSEVAPPARLPVRRSLLAPELWVADDPALAVELDDGALRIRSTLAADGKAHATQPPSGLKGPPRAPALAVTPGSACFLEADGRAAAGQDVVVFVMEYAGSERVAVHKHRLGPRHLPRIDLSPRTDRLRVAVRVTGPGELIIDRLALHGPADWDAIAHAPAAAPAAGTRRRTLIRRLLLGGLVALIVSNLFNLGRNAESRPYQVAPKKSLAIAQRSPFWSVKAGFATYQYLRKHLHGKQLVMPQGLDRLTWSLERISRLRLELVDDALELPGQTFRNLRRGATQAMFLMVGRRRVELYVYLGRPEIDRYVLTRYQGETSMMIMPEPMYRELVGAGR
jgi:FkbM family methyltransferase